MPQPYKIEIFARDYTFRDVGILGSPVISFDYLTLEKTTVQLKKITAKKGDFASITSFDGHVVYQGIVDDIVTDKTVKLTLKPLLTLLDVTVDYDRTVLQTKSLEFFLSYVIKRTYGSNSDTLQNITGLNTVITSSTENTALNVKSNVHELYDIISKSLTVYGVSVSAELKPQSKQLIFTIGRAGGDPFVIESDVKNCIEKTITIGDSYGNINKSVYINKNDETQTATYYLHTDGTVGTNNADRITPVFFTTEYIETDSDFAAEAQKRAIESLTPQKYNNQIELTYLRGDRLIEPEKMQIGKMVSIISGGNQYSSILTGFEKTETTVKLMFGVVRQELTKKLIIERRMA